MAFAGCGATRYPAHYVLTFTPPSAQAEIPAHRVGTLAIGELQCPDYLCEGRIVYRPTPAEVGFYQYHRWAVSPRVMIAQHLSERLRDGSFFTSVSGDASRAATDFVLTGSIARLEEVDEARTVAAVCTLSAELRESRTGAVVWRHTASERVEVGQRDVAGVVDGLITAVQRSVDDLVADMQPELARLAARPDTTRDRGTAASVRR